MAGSNFFILSRWRELTGLFSWVVLHISVLKLIYVYLLEKRSAKAIAPNCTSRPVIAVPHECWKLRRLRDNSSIYPMLLVAAADLQLLLECRKVPLEESLLFIRRQRWFRLNPPKKKKVCTCILTLVLGGISELHKSPRRTFSLN